MYSVRSNRIFGTVELVLAKRSRAWKPGRLATNSLKSRSRIMGSESSSRHEVDWHYQHAPLAEWFSSWLLPLRRRFDSFTAYSITERRRMNTIMLPSHMAGNIGVHCPKCKAKPGLPCINQQGQRINNPHRDRINKARGRTRPA